MRLFEFHQPVFEKVVSAGLSSLGLKGYQILVKNWIFDDPLHKKRIVLVICVLGMIQRWGRVNFLMKWGCWGHWGHWGCWGCRGHWGCKGSKAWKITSEDFWVIPVLEFSFFWCFEKKNICIEPWNIILNFSTFSVWGCTVVGYSTMTAFLIPSSPRDLFNMSYKGVSNILFDGVQKDSF